MHVTRPGSKSYSINGFVFVASATGTGEIGDANLMQVVIPEPASLALLGLGALLLGKRRR